MFLTSGAVIFTACLTLSLICFFIYLWIEPYVNLYNSLKLTKKEKFINIMSSILYDCSIWFAALAFMGIIVLIISIVV